eukprot:UN34630
MSALSLVFTSKIIVIMLTYLPSDEEKDKKVSHEKDSVDEVLHRRTSIESLSNSYRNHKVLFQCLDKFPPNVIFLIECFSKEEEPFANKPNNKNNNHNIIFPHDEKQLIQ